jgi:hypothetical protein
MACVCSDTYTYSVHTPRLDSLDSPPHSVQLFDSHDSAAAALAQFVREGLDAGDTMLIVARGDDWNRAAVALASSRMPLAASIDSGQLVVLDSATVLDTLLVGGLPDAKSFERGVGDLVRRRAARGRLRAYGDMVDLLAAERHFEAAARLEELWNDLGTRIPFTLFCGYSSSHFCDATSGEALGRIRQLHSHEHCAPDDFIAHALMA